MYINLNAYKSLQNYEKFVHILKSYIELNIIWNQFQNDQLQFVKNVITQPLLDDKLWKLFLCTNKEGKKNVTKEGKINLTTFFQTLQNKFNVIHFQILISKKLHKTPSLMKIFKKIGKYA